LSFAENGELLEKNGYTLRVDGKYYKYNYGSGAVQTTGAAINSCFNDSAIVASGHPVNSFQAWMDSIPSNRDSSAVLGIYLLQAPLWITAEGTCKYPNKKT
jgi:hypothetical protein